MLTWKERQLLIFNATSLEVYANYKIFKNYHSFINFSLLLPCPIGQVMVKVGA